MPRLLASSRISPRSFLWGICLLVVVTTGCRNTRSEREELLLAELRTRTRELEETREELLRHRQLNQLYQRHDPPLWVNPTFRPTTDAPTYPVKEITLGRGTGGVDEDNLPGDESLMVVLVPKDDDGTAVKVPGKVWITALEIAPDGLKAPLSRWEVTPEQLRRTWKTGLLGSGYNIPLQWERPPCHNRVRIVVRFQTLDRKEFETDKDITVQVLPGLSGPALPGPLPSGPPVLPSPSTPLLPPPNSTELPPPQISNRPPAARLLPPTPSR